MIYVAHPVGGISDILARTIAKHQGDTLVVNVPGVLTQQAQRQAHQNQQPLIVENSTLVIDPIVHGRDRTYDIVANFQEIMILGTAPNVFLVHESHPATNLAMFRRWAESSQADLTYSTSGSMTRIAAMEILERLSLPGRAIPYRGGSNAIQAVMRNEVVFHVGNQVGAAGPLSTKKVKSLLQKTDEFQTRGYYGIALPTTMSEGARTRWQRSMRDLVSRKEFQQDLTQFGFEIEVIQGSQIRPWLRKEIAYYQGAVKRFGISE